MCDVCYEEYPVSDMVSLSCGHMFCKHCTKDHIAFSISNGAANRIRCMNQECELEFDADDIKPFVTEE